MKITFKGNILIEIIKIILDLEKGPMQAQHTGLV